MHKIQTNIIFEKAFKIFKSYHFIFGKISKNLELLKFYIFKSITMHYSQSFDTSSNSKLFVSFYSSSSGKKASSKMSSIREAWFLKKECTIETNHRSIRFGFFNSNAIGLKASCNSLLSSREGAVIRLRAFTRRLFQVIVCVLMGTASSIVSKLGTYVAGLQRDLPNFL